MPAPPLSCDCHMHVFGPPSRYPPARTAAYAPREAGLAAYRAMAEALGLERTVLVQPSAYGTDNSCMLDAMAALGPERCRGVAVVDGETPLDELRAMRDAGVRGVRLNMLSTGRDQAGELREALPRMAERIAPLGLHVQIFASLGVLVEIAPTLAGCPAPVVLDHMASAPAAAGPEQPGLDTILELVAAGNVWVKLSGAYRISDREPGLQDAEAIMRAFVEANPARLVWGTDWPHIGPHAGPAGDGPPEVVYREIDNAGLLAMLRRACGDEETFRQVLVQNPGALYGF